MSHIYIIQLVFIEHLLQARHIEDQTDEYKTGWAMQEPTVGRGYNHVLTSQRDSDVYVMYHWVFNT